MAGARITASWADSFLQTLKANDIRLVSMVKPRNLTIVIMDNGVYQITGKQPAATASTADIVAIARGAGIASSHWVRDEAHFDALIARRFDEGGPVFLAAKIDDKPGTAQTPRDPSLIRNPFMRGPETGRASALDIKSAAVPDGSPHGSNGAEHPGCDRAAFRRRRLGAPAAWP